MVLTWRLFKFVITRINKCPMLGSLLLFSSTRAARLYRAHKSLCTSFCRAPPWLARTYIVIIVCHERIACTNTKPKRAFPDCQFESQYNCHDAETSFTCTLQGLLMKKYWESKRDWRRLNQLYELMCYQCQQQEIHSIICAENRRCANET